MHRPKIALSPSVRDGLWLVIELLEEVEELETDDWDTETVRQMKRALFDVLRLEWESHLDFIQDNHRYAPPPAVRRPASS